jgi:hypothetical protein
MNQTTIILFFILFLLVCFTNEAYETSFAAKFHLLPVFASQSNEFYNIPSGQSTIVTSYLLSSSHGMHKVFLHIGITTVIVFSFIITVFYDSNLLNRLPSRQPLDTAAIYDPCVR